MGTASPQLDYRFDWTGTYAALSAVVTTGFPAYTRSQTTDLGAVYLSPAGLWVTGGSRPLMLGGIPLVIPGGGAASVSAAGVLTSLTSMPISAGQGYFWLPANYLATVSAAGWYYGTFASATSVQVYNILYSGTGQPTTPTAAQITAGTFAGLSGGSGAQGTGAQTVTCTVPAGCLGTNGQFQFKYLASYNSSGNNKTISSAFGALSLFTSTVTTTTSQSVSGILWNSGSASVQVGTLTGGSGYATATQALAYGSVNTAAAVSYVVTMNNANAADFIILNGYEFTVNTI